MAGHIRGLDGLRALAIAAVLVFHLRPTALTGGFLGVDVFFVVSGFLITTLLLREMATRGRLDLPKFWVRRARRLLPALVLVVVTSVSVSLLIGEDLLVGIGRQSLGALTFSSNWIEIAAGSSYFAATSPQLFANFWSLAVEEQFYLLWPILFALVLALLPSPRRRAGVAAGVAVLSAVGMALLAQPGEDATRVYYGTDTHAFGLLLGIALAFLSSGDSVLGSSAWRRAAPWAGTGALAGLIVLMAVLNENHVITFRGGLFLGSLLTAVLIASLLPGQSPLVRLLELRPVTWLGQRSYGIYLWHWPVLLVVTALLPPAAVDSPGDWAVRVLALALTLAVSAASYRHLEMPVRRRGFRACFDDVRQAVTGPVLVPKLAVGAVGLLGVMTVAGIATAPQKSEAQVAIEAGQQAIAAAAPAAGTEGPGRQFRAEAPPDRSVPSGEEVTAFGDSMIVTSTHALQDRFPGIQLDALSNNQWKHAADVVGTALAEGRVGRAVVIDYGTNAGVSDPAVVREVLDLLGPKRIVVVVNLYSSSTFIESSNTLLAEVVAGYPNAIVADWNAAIGADPSLLQSDRTHPDIEGALLFADTVRAAFEELAARS